MRLASYLSPRGGEAVGVVEGEELLGLPGDHRLIDLLADPVALSDVAAAARHEPTERVPLTVVDLLAPIPVPPSVRDFLAFEEHRRNARGGGEVDPDWYELPIFYFSNPAAIVGPTSEVAVAPGSVEWDYELEFAAVIGATGRDLRPDEAADHIAGYCLLCDFSARDLQRREMRQGLGPAKGKDGATSLGPFLVTADELEPFRSKKGFALEMEVSVNGRRYGGGRLDDLYWSFGEMISYASRGTEVRPGDVFGSGTVGTGCILEHAALGRGEEFPYLHPGDEVVLRVEEVGELRHRIVNGRTPWPLRP